jgi:hypothetical protein
VATTTAQLIALAKEAADLANVTDYVTDETWLSWLNTGIKELHRFVTNKFKDTYFRTHDFTLTSGEYRAALPADFWKIKGLDIDAETPRRREVTRFNFSERNKFRANNLRSLDPGRYCTDRVYNVVGSGLIQIEAEEQAQGAYRLYYVPKPVLLADLITVAFDMGTGDNGNVPALGSLDGIGSWAFVNAAFNHTIPVDGSVDLTLAFDSPNGAFSGAYHIVDVGTVADGFGRPTVGVSNLASVFGLSGALVGTGTYSYYPIGYGNEIDEELEPYVEYIWLTAAIKSLVKEESFAQAKLLADQRNLIREDLAEAVEQDQAGPVTIIDTDDDGWL